MKKFFYGISVFCLLCLLWAGSYGTYRMTESNEARENTEQFLKLGQEEGQISAREVWGDPLEEEGEDPEAGSGASSEEVYYLKEQDGYVIVCLPDRSTVYETTSISVELLPESVKKEILQGKYVGSRRELYGFLENYSS